MKKYMFALMSFVALAAYAVTPATQWGDVSPTNTLARVAAAAGLMSTNTSSGVYIGGGLKVANHPTIVRSLSDDAAWADRLGYGSISFGGGSFASGQFSYALGVSCQALGDRSFAHGYESRAYGVTDYAGGTGCIASNGNTIAIGMYSCSTNYSFVWQGYPVLYPQLYYSHGRGSFNINPVGGLAGFWVGETNMEDHLVAFAPKLAYNLYPVDVGGGTRTTPANTDNYVMLGWDAQIAVGDASHTNAATTAIGNATRVGGANSSALACNAEALGDEATAVGAHSTAGMQGLAVGVSAHAYPYDVSIGNRAQAGREEDPNGGNCTSVGFESKALNYSTALGSHAEAREWKSIAIGQYAIAKANGAVQLGDGENADAFTVKFYDHTLMDSSGHVPLLAGKGAYDLSTDAGITNALADVIRALGGSVQ